MTVTSGAPEWKIVRRNQCRPDLRCVCCRSEIGHDHRALCYAAMIARSEQRKKENDG